MLGRGSQGQPPWHSVQGIVPAIGWTQYQGGSLAHPVGVRLDDGEESSPIQYAYAIHQRTHV